MEYMGHLEGLLIHILLRRTETSSSIGTEGSNVKG